MWQHKVLQLIQSVEQVSIDWCYVITAHIPAQTPHIYKNVGNFILQRLSKNNSNNDEITFSQKTIEFHETVKRGLHTICHGPQFSRTCVEMENMAKKVLWFRQKTAYSGERISRKTFSRNAHESDESLSRLYSHFARISSVRFFFVIVRE